MNNFSRGSVEATKQAHSMILALIEDPEVDITQMFAKNKLQVIAISTSDKTIVTVSFYIKLSFKSLLVFILLFIQFSGIKNQDFPFEASWSLRLSK